MTDISTDAHSRTEAVDAFNEREVDPVDLGSALESLPTSAEQDAAVEQLVESGRLEQWAEAAYGVGQEALSIDQRSQAMASVVRSSDGETLAEVAVALRETPDISPEALREFTTAVVTHGTFLQRSDIAQELAGRYEGDLVSLAEFGALAVQPLGVSDISASFSRFNSSRSAEVIALDEAHEMAQARYDMAIQPDVVVSDRTLLADFGISSSHRMDGSGQLQPGNPFLVGNYRFEPSFPTAEAALKDWITAQGAEPRHTVNFQGEYLDGTPTGLTALAEQAGDLYDNSGQNFAAPPPLYELSIAAQRNGTTLESVLESVAGPQFDSFLRMQSSFAVIDAVRSDGGIGAVIAMQTGASPEQIIAAGQLTSMALGFAGDMTAPRPGYQPNTDMWSLSEPVPLSGD